MSILCVLRQRTGTYNKGVPLPGEDLDRVDDDRLVVDRISLNDRHVVPVDREREVRVARHRDKTETVTLALSDIDDGEFTGFTARKPTETVDQRGVSTTAVPERSVWYH